MRTTFNRFGKEKFQTKAVVVAFILLAALLGFEIFNFDTTRFALRNLFGEMRFAGLSWASVLAFAFCSIDFAGLVRMFTPEQGKDEPLEVWLLSAAWLLGATMNALMTWYATAVVIMSRPLGTTWVSSQDIAFYAPIFVAVLVWLTRILFIGSISVAGDRLLHGHRDNRRYSRGRRSSRAHGDSTSRAPLRESSSVAFEEIDTV